MMSRYVTECSIPPHSNLSEIKGQALAAREQVLYALSMLRINWTALRRQTTDQKTRWMMEPDGTVVDKGASAARGETPPTRDAIPLPFIHRSVQYQWMLEFTDSIPPEGDLGNLRNRLYHVTDGEGAFSRFLQELQHYPAEAARWRRYRAQNIRSRIEDWIQTYQLDATPPWQVPSEGFDLSEASDEEKSEGDGA